MTKVALIRTSPAISDPKELTTIISTSVRAAFGDCQAHTVGVRILDCRTATAAARRRRNTINTSETILQCPDDALPYIRAALTLPSPPSYFQGSIYTFDFLKIDDKSSNPEWISSTT